MLRKKKVDISYITDSSMNTTDIKGVYSSKVATVYYTKLQVTRKQIILSRT